MLRLVLFLAGILLAAVGLDWLANRPGTMTMSWQGYVIETSVFRFLIVLTALVALCTLAWGLLRRLWQSPAAIGQIFTRRRERKGIDALTRGLVAISSGDKALALTSAVQARKALPNEPLTHLLRAQAAQLQGDSSTARRIYEAMLASPDTELAGLQGLYLEAQKVGEDGAAAQFAARALTANPKLPWPAQALFDLQVKRRDWDGALDTLALARKHGHIDKKLADRRRAVVLTAQAQACEDERPDQALALASEAHGLAPDLIPAAAIAGRVHAARGATPKAAKIIQKTWKLAPHPDLAAAYAYARAGDSASDRLARIRQLAASNTDGVEGPIAIANVAIDAHDWDAAKAALTPVADSNPTQRVAMLMARIEGEGFDNAGRVREWLARAVHAGRDPAWTADGVVAEQWAPVSPVTGALDAFEWRVPSSSLDTPAGALISSRIEDLLKLGAPGNPALRKPSREEPTTIEIVEPTRRDAPKGATVSETRAEWLDAPAAPRATGNGANGATHKASANGHSSNGHAAKAQARPDDPGTEPLDANANKSQLERYRIVGAKN